MWGPCGGDERRRSAVGARWGAAKARALPPTISQQFIRSVCMWQWRAGTPKGRKYCRLLPCNSHKAVGGSGMLAVAAREREGPLPCNKKGGSQQRRRRRGSRNRLQPLRDRIQGFGRQQGRCGARRTATHSYAIV